MKNFVGVILFFAAFSCHGLPTADRRSTPTPSINTTVTEYMHERCEDENKEFVSPINSRPHCCRKCPPGTGMLQLCTDNSDTICRPCKEGSEFSDIFSATAKCLQCKQCQEVHPFAKARTYCTPSMNTVCGCISGFFLSEITSFCKSCTKCPPGHGAERECSWKSDSTCKPCAAGFWSSTESATDACQTCRVCKPGQLMMRPCSATQNSICCPLNNPNCGEEFAIEEDEMQLIENESSSKLSSDDISEVTSLGEDYPMITIYCSLLGLVIFTLLIYVVYKLWQQHLVGLSASGSAGSDGKSPSSTGIDHNGLHPAFIKSASTSGSENNSLIKPKNQKHQRHENYYLLAEDRQQYSQVNKNSEPSVNPKLLMEIATSLSNDKKWKTVGGLLGYTEEQLQEFQGTEVLAQPDNGLPAHRMLTAWVSKSESSLSQLQFALAKVNAKDLSHLLPSENQISPAKPII